MWAWWRRIARLPAPPAASPNPPEASPASFRTARSDVESPQWWSPVKRPPARGRAVAPPSPPSSVGSGGAVVADLMGRLSVQGEEEAGGSDGAASPSSLIMLSSSSDSDDGDGAVSRRAPTPGTTRRPLFPVPAPAATAAPAVVKPAAAPPPPRRRPPPALPPPENDPYALPVSSDSGEEVCVVDDDDESSEGARSDDSDFVLSDGGDTAATASDWTPGGRGNTLPGPSRPLPLTGPLTPAPRAAAAAFRRRRDAATAALFAHYNLAVFGGRLPADTQVTWSPRLRTTAGVTHFLQRRGGGGGAGAGASTALPPTRLARVELSTKVIDSDARLETTLLHELCHVAAWVVDGAARPPHGPAFQKWAAAAAAALPGAPRVTTCHSYAVHAPFEWRCVGGGRGGGDGGGGGNTTGGCGRVYRRHSKSIDVARHACGACRGRLAFVGRMDADGTVQGGGGGGGGGKGHQPSRPPNAFAQFVAARFATVKASMPTGTPHKDVMKALGAAWREEKARRGGATAA